MGKFIQYSTKESQYDGPFDSKVGWSAAGMGDLFVTDSGKLIAVDGGYNNDAEGFVELLEKYSGGKKPVVDLWIITHPHGDHYGAINVISKTPELAARIEVKKFMYWFPEEFRNGDGIPNALAYANRDMEAVRQVFGAEYEQPYLDQKIIIDDMEIHFLFVPDDCTYLDTATKNPNSNQVSLIFTVKGTNKKAMITGDAFDRGLLMALWRHYRDMKCDYLQLPHHGLCDTGDINFYKKVNAKTIFIPISIAGDRSMHSDMYAGNYKRDANLWAEDNADLVYKAFEGTVEVEM